MLEAVGWTEANEPGAQVATGLQDASFSVLVKLEPLMQARHARSVETVGVPGETDVPAAQLVSARHPPWLRKPCQLVPAMQERQRRLVVNDGAGEPTYVPGRQSDHGWHVRSLVGVAIDVL